MNSPMSGKQAVAAALRMIESRRGDRSRELAGRGLRLVRRMHLRPGYVVCDAIERPLYRVTAEPLPARARHYVVVLGENVSGRVLDGHCRPGEPYRTSGHVLDDLICQEAERA